MSHIINKILGKTIGVNLRRTRPRKVDKFKGKPIYVEFVGVPGVGKSTLYENVFKQVKSKWRNIHELQKIFIRHANSKSTESLSLYQELAQQKIQNVASRNYTGIDKMNIIKYFHSVLIDDSLVYLFNNDYNIMSDEGLIHNFGEAILALSKSKEEEFKSLMERRAVIYCYASPEIVAKRILEREKKTGELLPQHKVDSYDNLVLLQQESLYFKHQIIDSLSNYNIPILSIDTSNSMSQNVDQVVQFLNQLTNST